MGMLVRRLVDAAHWGLAKSKTFQKILGLILITLIIKLSCSAGV